MKKRSINTGIWGIFIVMKMCGVIKQFYGFHFGTWKTIQNSVSERKITSDMSEDWRNECAVHKESKTER